MAEILLPVLLVSDNKWPPYSNSTSFSFDILHSLPLAYHFALAYQISFKLNQPRQSFDVILIFKDGLESKSTSCFGFSNITHLSADPISTTYLNLLIDRHYSFRF